MTRPRGFTLLELVLSATILASVAALAAVLWAQASAWTGDAASENRGVRLARVLELLRAQWTDRRTSAALDDKESSVLVRRDSLVFVTATAVLERGWPLVRASYRIERDDDTGSGRASAWKLVYEEAPIIDFGGGAPPGGDATGGAGALRRPTAAPPIRRMVLLGGCERLILERFGRDPQVEERERLVASGAGVDAEPFTTGVDRSPPAWREIEEKFEGKAPALRLRGTFDDREFACVFVIEVSR